MIIKKGIYKGWNLMSAIKDLINIRLGIIDGDIYPMWFRKQFKITRSKQE